MHWGTFLNLTEEPVLEPPKRLLQELEKRKINSLEFCVLEYGQTIMLWALILKCWSNLWWLPRRKSRLVELFPYPVSEYALIQSSNKLYYSTKIAWTTSMDYPTIRHHFLVITAASRGAQFFVKKALQQGHSVTALCRAVDDAGALDRMQALLDKNNTYSWRPSICRYSGYNRSFRQKYLRFWNLSNAPQPRHLDWSSILLCWSYQLRTNAE